MKKVAGRWIASGPGSHATEVTGVDQAAGAGLGERRAWPEEGSTGHAAPKPRQQTTLGKGRSGRCKCRNMGTTRRSRKSFHRFRQTSQRAASDCKKTCWRWSAVVAAGANVRRLSAPIGWLAGVEIANTAVRHSQRCETRSVFEGNGALPRRCSWPFDQATLQLNGALLRRSVAAGRPQPPNLRRIWNELGPSDVRFVASHVSREIHNGCQRRDRTVEG